MKNLNQQFSTTSLQHLHINGNHLDHQIVPNFCPNVSNPSKIRENAQTTATKEDIVMQYTQIDDVQYVHDILSFHRNDISATIESLLLQLFDINDEEDLQNCHNNNRVSEYIISMASLGLLTQDYIIFLTENEIVTTQSINSALCHFEQYTRHMAQSHLNHDKSSIEKNVSKLYMILILKS